jgi:hypothetical protein
LQTMSLASESANCWCNSTKQNFNFNKINLQSVNNGLAPERPPKNHWFRCSIKTCLHKVRIPKTKHSIPSSCASQHRPNLHDQNSAFHANKIPQTKRQYRVDGKLLVDQFPRLS